MKINQEIERLKEKIKELEEINGKLKKLLDEAGIKYDCIFENSDKKVEKYDGNQGARIKRVDITEALAVKFFSMFWGRTDVYSKKYVNKTTGAIGYFPQCNNFWTYGCPKRNGLKIKCIDCNKKQWKKLGRTQIIQHLQGNADDCSDVIGVYPLFSDGTCRFIVFDFDDHGKYSSEKDCENRDGKWKSEVDTMREICEKNGIKPLVERSQSGEGAHIWIFFKKPIEASLARKFGNALLRKGEEYVNLKTFRYYDRMLPMQDYLLNDSLGNLIALPMQGKALNDGNSAFVDENWNAYPNQWEVLFSQPKLTEEFVNECIEKWTETEEDVLADLTSNKPWECNNKFYKEDVEGIVHITLADGIYIDSDNLSPRIQNRTRRLAAFSNPKFYKNQAMGLSNYDNSRIIYLGSDEGKYIKIPRGLKDKLIENLLSANIEYDIQDERSCGKEIDVSFVGNLKDSQKNAVMKMLKTETGILSAATAFGKTVVCANLIAQRKTSTIILLESSALIEQWQKALNDFLRIDEQLPQYETPSGRIKTRKSIIGKIHGAHDSSTGIIDIAMVGSLRKKGEWHNRLKDYGMVILDECHHAASQTIVSVLQEVRAKYVYGVTATPYRGDGLDKINTMLLGPIRFRYTAKEKAAEQGIGRFVKPRFTRTVVPSFEKNNMHPNEAYGLIRDNPIRDELIINDVRRCIKEKRTPVVLSKFRDHSQRLYEKLKNDADKVFLLTGTNSKKEQKTILEQMNQVKDNESMILIATGKLIGEGFDYPRLDTLMMATPVSWKGIVEQYAGRLNRDYKNKKNVIIYDYVDRHIPIFENMYNRRLKAYKQIGYDIYSENIKNKQNVNSIYDFENYMEVYKRDLKEANEEIIISSPSISWEKVQHFIELLKEKQLTGIKIIVLTWEADLYKYGDVSYWMQLHEQMKNAGFELNLIQDYCERFTIIDREIVWYGSMNFLGKEDVEDNLMRVCSKSIAEELLELTFG